MKMYLSLLCGVLLLSAETVTQAQNHQTSASGSPVSGFATATNVPAPVHTSRRSFRIPYQYDPHEISRLGAREIRLFVSQDRGVTWNHVQSVQPAAGRFDFQAPTDGEYWFTVQTVDRNGQLHPGGQVLQPGLVVVVDTVKPTINIDLREVAPGRVALDWSIDQNVDPESIVLEYTQSGQSDWQRLGVAPTPAGTTTWSVPGGGLVAVRGRVRDLAGNESQSQFQIQVNPVTAQPPLSTGLSGSSVAGALPNSPLASQPLPPPRTSGYPLPQQPPGNAAPLPESSQPSSVPQFGAGPVPYTPPQLSTSTQRSPQALSGTPSPTGAPAGPPVPTYGQTPVTQPVLRPDDQLVSTVPGSAATGELPAFSTETASTGHRIVRERSFKIDYRVDDVGPSGIGAVELYVTQNGGEKWYRYGIDEDRRSPFDVEVPMDGVFGFSIRVASGAGLADPPPRPGDAPDIVIEVDASPPVVELHPLRQGTGEKRNRILITWQADDQRLADRPIAISYATAPHGPWTQITDWRENTGEYIWTVDSRIPPRLYVRIVARDAAGNIAKVDTPQAVLVDISRPTARIVNVNPGSGQR